MKNLLLLIMLFILESCIIKCAVGGLEPFRVGEEVKRPTNDEEAIKLTERYNETKKEAEEAKRRIENNQKKLKQPALPESEKTNLANQITQDNALMETYNGVKEVLEQPEVQKLVKEYQKQLTQGIEIPKAAITAEEIPSKLENAFKNKDENALKKLSEAFKSSVDLETLNKRITKTKDVDTKLNIIDQKRREISHIQDLMQKELEATANKNSSEKYKNELSAFKRLIDSKIEVLDLQAISIDLQRVNFFVRLAQGLKAWFDKNFDFHKSTEKKITVAEELEVIKKELKAIAENKKNIEPFARLFTEIENLESDASKVIEFINLLPSKKTVDESELTTGLSFVTKIMDLEKQITPVQAEQINETYKNLQLLTADLGLKEKRYRGDSPALYTSELKEYKQEFDPERIGRTPKDKKFGPHQAYEALGLTKATLEYPEKISLKEINDAYDKQRTTLDEQSYEWQAARNAFTLLGSTTGKENYDAFLKDFSALKQKGIDPLQPTSKASLDWLNTKGELSRLEISLEMKKNIETVLVSALVPAMEKIGTQKTKAFSIVETLSNIKEALLTAIDVAEEFLPKATEEVEIEKDLD